MNLIPNDPAQISTEPNLFVARVVRAMKLLSIGKCEWKHKAERKPKIRARPAVRKETDWVVGVC